MSQAEKLKKRFLSTPIPKNFRWEELVRLMENSGFAIESGSGSARRVPMVHCHLLSEQCKRNLSAIQQPLRTFRHRCRQRPKVSDFPIPGLMPVKPA